MDFGVKMDLIHIKCDNTNAINLNKNLVEHSWHIGLNITLLGSVHKIFHYTRIHPY